MKAAAKSRARAPKAVAARPPLAWGAIDKLGVKRLATDSREVRPGDTFVAYPGEARDGRDYIGQALARGAAAVLWERRNFAWNTAWRVPNLGVPDLRRRAGEIAHHVYGKPSAQLWTIGVTGTNGKTSCSQWIAHALTRAGRRCAVIGTLGSGFPGRLEAAVNTTPDAVTLHAALDRFARAGARAVAMEVSSHGLDQHRLSGVQFDVALLTNLSRDHLDYHGTLERYQAAKARLFAWPTLKWAILNLDDAFGIELATRLTRADLRIVGYGFGRNRLPRSRGLLRVQGRNLRLDARGLAFDVSTPWGSTTVESRLIGRFNAANVLGSLATLLASDAGLEATARALARVQPPPGRVERFGGGLQPLVVVDYAHTPDALEQVLRALRETIAPRRARSAAGERRLICVFGCGGERDRGKRPLMGAVAADLADRVVVTSDNPRGEDPLAIIGEIARGARGADVAVEPDRARAIRLALDGARRGDVVLVAGKGHEQYQEIGGRKHPFSDAAVVADILRRRRGRSRCP